MPPEEYLRDLARQAITADKIPTHWPGRMWGGPGIGVSCALCAQPVHEMEFEVYWAMDRAGPRLDLSHFHYRCFARGSSSARRRGSQGRAEPCRRRSPRCPKRVSAGVRPARVSGLGTQATASFPAS